MHINAAEELMGNRVWRKIKKDLLRSQLLRVIFGFGDSLYLRDGNAAKLFQSRVYMEPDKIVG